VASGPGKSPKVSVLEAESSLRRHDSTKILGLVKIFAQFQAGGFAQHNIGNTMVLQDN
jgi:hypothetical protein